MGDGLSADGVSFRSAPTTDRTKDAVLFRMLEVDEAHVVQIH